MCAVALARKKTEPVLAVTSAAEWHDWLASRHGSSTGVLLRIAKKAAQKTITYAEALDVALAWGWIGYWSTRRAAEVLLLRRSGTKLRIDA